MVSGVCFYMFAFSVVCYMYPVRKNPRFEILVRKDGPASKTIVV